MLSIYEIAYHLRMPIYKLAAEMTYEELLGWFDYFERRPPEWRADDRAAKLLQAQGVKEKPWKLFSSLDNVYNGHKKRGEFDVSGLKSSMLFSKMLGAKGGDKLEL